MSILVIGVLSIAASAFVFFVVLPPTLSTIDGTGEYLSTLKVPGVSLGESVQAVRNYVESIPDCAGTDFGGCLGYDMRESKVRLNNVAYSLDNTDHNIRTSVVDLEARIHQTDDHRYSLKPAIISYSAWMISVSALLTLSGAAFFMIVRKLEKELALRLSVADISLPELC